MSRGGKPGQRRPGPLEQDLVRSVKSRCVRVGMRESVSQSRCLRVGVSESMCQSHCVGVTVSESLCQSRCIRVTVSEAVCQSHCLTCPSYLLILQVVYEPLNYSEDILRAPLSFCFENHRKVHMNSYELTGNAEVLRT